MNYPTPCGGVPVIHAEGEAQAASNLAEAGRVIASQPATLQLRYLQTLTDIAAEKNSTIVLTDIAGFLTQVGGTGQHLLEALRTPVSDEVLRSRG